MPNYDFPESPLGNPEERYVNEKMTIREHFASMAMQGYMSHRCTPDRYSEGVAKYAVLCADALIKELNKTSDS